MQEEDKNCLTIKEFKKAQHNIELTHTLTILLKEYIQKHYYDSEGAYETIATLECIQEKLCKVCIDFMDTNV